MVNILSNQNSLLNLFIAEMRDEIIQKDSMRFRRNMERVGEIMAYEISKCLEYETKEITTPLGISNMNIPVLPIVNATILRAGLPFHQGILNYFDKAENAFISAHRKYHNDASFTIQFEHLSGPSIENKILILSDPMLASGASMEIAYKALIERGKPRHTHIVTIIASEQGINYVKKHIPMKDVTIWAGDVDDELTVKSYIVPGLGDAGDLAYGSKM
ncbi:MAG: uracil phosphoribosyltransferase [Bacteroidetes bacterium GWC2_33_15]|nr:MAG: uracil phosphoribosyltransferase [Bacteroidetes bacterium GWA2_33_15]OFX52608.1 MAG: uracil phosphoribosyltransferase [Bacteroidetes bacterium GWC2_33_15]OFX63953.1 MAG: uracil phosphoribosyltransferase [Bacteroidetes bacterium GWB2_32_14]OFX70780.1 MAG: uracil phosphoribosyltransferase [Bacteroidetes bacterium GWD2_33_33]HAN19908.1 uracil phosphoribosyltransferase [Bacteroidales bacterium]